MALIQPLLSNTSLSLSLSPSLLSHTYTHQPTSAHKSNSIFLQCSDPPLSLTIPRLNYWVRLQLSKLYLKGDLLPWGPGIAIPSLWAHPLNSAHCVYLIIMAPRQPVSGFLFYGKQIHATTFVVYAGTSIIRAWNAISAFASLHGVSPCSGSNCRLLTNSWLIAQTLWRHIPSTGAGHASRWGQSSIRYAKSCR